MDCSGGIGLIRNYLSEIAKQQLFQLGFKRTDFFKQCKEAPNARSNNIEVVRSNYYLFDARLRNFGIGNLAPVPTLLTPAHVMPEH